MLQSNAPLPPVSTLVEVEDGKAPGCFVVDDQWAVSAKRRDEEGGA